jgi:hypothetical protein
MEEYNSEECNLETLKECDYQYWMKYDLLSIIQISFIACGNEPLHSHEPFFQFQVYYGRQHKVYKLLLSALEANKIKATSQDNLLAKASPVEWLAYLKGKDYSLPRYLEDIVFDELPEKRSQESYQIKEIRGNKKAVEAVIRTLLDIYPDLPKAELIKLRPISHYANGAAHSDESLMKMISEIEGKNRDGGRISSEKLEKIKKDIPKHWLPIPKKA